MAVPAQQPAAIEAAPPPPADDPTMAAFGAVLAAAPHPLTVAAVLPDSWAERLGVAPGDRLLYVDRVPLRDHPTTAAAFRGWQPGTRLSAVLRRDLRVVSLEGRFPEPEPAFKRGSDEFSAQEKKFAGARLAKTTSVAQAALSQAPSLNVTTQGRQSFWVRLDDGIKNDVARGDILEGVVTTAVPTDPSLDYLSITPGSKVWAQVVAVNKSQEAVAVRLAFFKLRLDGGQAYFIAGKAVGAAGPQKMVLASQGGSLVAALPIDGEGKKKKAGPLLDPDMRLRVELTTPLTLTEPESFYQAGPGMWIKTQRTAQGQVCSISYLVPGRSAANAELRVGDAVVAIDGDKCAKLESDEVIARLYGKPKSRVKLSIVRAGGAKPETVEIKRGVIYENGQANDLPMPYVLAQRAAAANPPQQAAPMAPPPAPVAAGTQVQPAVAAPPAPPAVAVPLVRPAAAVPPARPAVAVPQARPAAAVPQARPAAAPATAPSQ